ncbi:MAG: translation initiation factor IF-2 [Porphyromonas sp.]|nr:translation initiation factor IF-2 [Porphyromonas sp.]
MSSIRINKVIRDLNVGLPSVVEFLRKKGSEIDENPNSKISANELKMLVQEFCKDWSKDEREALIAKYIAPKDAPTGDSKKDPAKAESPKAESVTPTTPKVGIKVTGHIDLDAKKPATKPLAPQKVEELVAKKEEPQKTVEVKPAESQPKVEEVKSPEPPKVDETPRPPKVAEPVVVEQPKVEEKKKEEKAKEPVKPISDKKEKKEEVVKSQDTQKSASEGEKEESSIFRIKSDAPSVGVKVVGVVDLSTLESSSRGPKSSEKGRKKRNRISGAQKVDVTKVQGAEEKREKHHSKDKNANRPPKQEVGRKAKKKQAAPPPKPEVTQEDIQKQIKETLAQMQSKKNKGTAQAAKYRKDKREAHRREQDELEKIQSEDRTLQLTEYVTANDLAQMINVPVNDIIMLCFNLGMMVSINQRLEKETIDLILDEYGYEPVYVEAQVLDAIQEEEDSEEDLLPRAPIVTVMGHVDHGKTSLLDSIRNTDVISGEAGGITQHVGAYGVTLKNGRKLTFLDTPGHEAFTAMRARGAKVTDIVIIVVAADDGVMPQTKEAINHASLAGVPIIFAINKVDKPHANPEKIKEELANLNYLVEDWGGKYQSQEISAKKGTGIYELLEKVLLEADILELKANPNKRAVATVLESTMEMGRGYTTKVLIHEGTLHVGDHILAGVHYGRVKALFNERGANVQSVGPSDPVKVLGLNGAVQAGEAFNVLETEQEVREIASKRTQLKREQRERTQRIPTLESLGQRIAEGKVQELNVIVKGDVDGSVEALSDSIVKLSTEEIRVNVIHKAVGQISDSDVILASASDAVIIGFQVRPAASARKLAENEGVEIRTYSIIYTALDDVKQAMEGMLSPEIKERVTANLEVRETFRITKVGTIAGCMVKDGKVSRTDKVRVIRDGIVIFSGALGSLKRFKDDVKEVGNGFECGLNIDNFNDISVGDIIEAYEEFEVKKKL